MPKRSFQEWLDSGESIVFAEGYLFEFQRRGYLVAGPFTPTVVLDHPELVEQMHEEFVHAGSDVVLAFTYYGHREKLRLIGREDDLESLNTKALQLAKKVADKHGLLFAGNICNTNQYDPADPATHKAAHDIFKEQIEWIVAAGADFILGETYADLSEAKLALKCIQDYGKGLPSVINLAPNASWKTREGIEYEDACKELADSGATVVGLNCGFGPASIIPCMRKIREKVKGHLACLPVAYRTTMENPTMQSLVIPETGKMAFPDNLDYYNSTADDFRTFGEEMKKLNVIMPGICCGATSRYIRSLAEAVGKTPAASQYNSKMHLHYIYGDQEHFRGVNTEKLRMMQSPMLADS